MTDYENAEKLRAEYLKNTHPEQNERNICRGRRNWNVCDYGNVYAGSGLECWKQGAPHWCVYCERVKKEGQE